MTKKSKRRTERFVQPGLRGIRIIKRNKKSLSLLELEQRLLKKALVKKKHRVVTPK